MNIAWSRDVDDILGTDRFAGHLTWVCSRETKCRFNSLSTDEAMLSSEVIAAERSYNTSPLCNGLRRTSAQRESSAQHVMVRAILWQLTLPVPPEEIYPPEPPRELLRSTMQLY